MKAILLSGGGYYGLENVKFPVEVDCNFVTYRGCSRDLVSVSVEELLRIGMNPARLSPRTKSLSFFLGKSIELKSENAK